MVTSAERKLILWLVRLHIWGICADGLWGRAVFRPMWGTAWLLEWIERRQVVDDFHHAPACMANHWCRQVLVFRRCTCGAARASIKTQD